MKLLLLGYYGFGNFGDDLILETLATRLSAHFQVGAVNYGKRQSRQLDKLEEQGVIRRHKIYVERRALLSKLNVLLQIWQMVRIGRQYDVVAFGGGTQLFETRKNGLLPLLSKVIFLQFMRVLYGVRVGHLFVGVNTPRSKCGRLILKRILHISELLILRDKESYKVCLELGAEEGKLYLAADAVYLRASRLAEGLCQGDLQTVGISIFPYFHHVERNAEKDLEYAKRLELVLHRLSDEGRKQLRLVFLGSQATGNLNDIAYARALAEKFRGHVIEYVDYDLDTEDYLLQLGKMDMVIAMRLHILIAATLSGVKRILALPYQEKIEEEARALGVAVVGTPHDLESMTVDLQAVAAQRRELNERALLRFLDWTQAISVTRQKTRRTA